MKRTATMRAALVLAAAAIALAACGSTNSTTKAAAAPAPAVSSGPADNGVSAVDPDTVVDRAKAALKQAKSFHLKGGATEDGSPVAVDLEVAGSDLAGSITYDKVKLQVLTVAGKDYLRTGKAGWTKLAGKDGAAAAELLADRWVLVPAGGDDDLGSFFDLTKADNLLSFQGPLTKGPSKRIGDTAAVSVVDKDGATMYVAATGEPYPLRLEEKPGGDALVLSEFGKTFPAIKAPTGSNVIDLGKLGA
jgi:hypothetical protein